jgi:HNH endonuclease
MAHPYTAHWNKLSRDWRRQHPLCQHCMDEGRVVAAYAVDHKVPHKGDPAIMYDLNNLQSLCESCHNAWKQRIERRGYDNTIGLDGWPIDPMHPSNRRDIAEVEYFPNNLGPSAIPLIIVCGPPAGGKSTYVHEYAGHDDIIIDLDGIRIRNQMLADLATASAPRAWFITPAPKGTTRQHWHSMLGAKRTLLLKTHTSICLYRVHSDPIRSKHKSDQHRIINAWWQDYTPWDGDTVVGPRASVLGDNHA